MANGTLPPNSETYPNTIQLPLHTVSDKVNQTIAYIIRHHGDILSLEEAAELAGITSQHLSQLFHRTTGFTFVRYYNTYRVNRAAKLLADTDREVGSIAVECGFISPSYFSKQFRRCMKKTPLAYRKEVCERRTGR